MEITGYVTGARGLPEREKAQLRRLVEIFNRHQGANEVKKRYYEGHIPLKEVNLGLALPEGLRGLEIGCAWGEKTVDVLAARSMFDGFVSSDGSEAETMTAIMTANRLRAEYMKACRDELKFGCTFATLTRDQEIGCRIRFHAPDTAAAEWDGKKGRIGCGFAVIALNRERISGELRPSLLHLHTEDAVWEISRGETDQDWTARRMGHIMGRPLMEPFVWNATSEKPFGRSRLKEPVRRLIQSYVRTVANATIGLEFATSPQKYLLGVTDEQYDAVVSQKFRSYVGSIFTSTSNPETGENPVFGQLAQGGIEPHVQMLRMLSTQFSAATGLSVTDVGVVNDANPTSSDAILAQTQSLILMAEQLNAGNGDSLANVAKMAQAIARNVRPEELTEEELAVVPHFKNPAMPSVSSMTDAAIKLASAREGFSQTDIFLEMTGFSQADIRRIRAQERRRAGLSLLEELESGAGDEGENAPDAEGGTGAPGSSRPTS